MPLTNRQEIALGTPVARAEEALQRQFWRGQAIGGATYSTILTVNK